jgi:hypothetical protein
MQAGVIKKNTVYSEEKTNLDLQNFATKRKKKKMQIASL